jgi:predicted AlkP superfamily pyrophosphatase or phosphodiesterase
MRPTLTIFIDGLPFDQLENMPFARTLESRARLVPSLGYSVNCQTELFTGKSPDELGFWCEWSYEPETSPFLGMRHFLKLVSPIEWLYPAKRVFHRVLDRLFSAVSYTKNIPISYLSMFDETGYSVFDPRFEQPSLLDDQNLKKFLHHEFAPGRDRDLRATRAVLDYIEKRDSPGSVLVTLVGIDGCSHWEGVGSAPYMEQLAENDEAIRSLTEAYLKKERDGVVFVVSDHGMSNIDRTISIDLEGRFGRPSKATYAYFSEATLLRVWINDPALQAPIREYLDSIHELEYLDDDERKEFQLTRKSFGDLIYHTPVGVQIVPSFWGPKPSVGMHGHHPRYPEQHGICLGSDAGLFEGSVRAVDFYHVLGSFSQISERVSP